jgi:competence protein ComEC
VAVSPSPSIPPEIPFEPPVTAAAVDDGAQVDEVPSPNRRAGPLALVSGSGRPRTLTDLAVVLAAVATWLGAHLARPALVLVSGLVLVAAVVWRRPLLLVVACAVTASGLGAFAWDAVVPRPDRTVDEQARLAGDPEERAGAQVVVVELTDGTRAEAWARGSAAAPIRHLLAGQTIHLRGRLEARPDGSDWLARRHVSNRLLVDEATDPGPAALPWAVANRARRLLEQGSVGLPYEQRALFAGFVLGDDRHQDPATLDAFRAAGLSHLLVVSGQNVVFVLAVARPLLARLRLGPRLAVTLALLGLFATLTRFEPSVLRATAMAAIAVLAANLGRPVSSLRVLAIAVTALVLADPLLEGALGFRLSVAASLGIIVVAHRIEAHLPGPRWLVAPLAVTLAAQIGVAPVLIPAFGPMPVAAIPANLAAVPVAGLVMMWGSSAGLLAGVASTAGWHGVARLVQLPVRVGLWWITEVADRASTASTATVGLPAVGAGLAALVALRLRGDRRSAGRVAVVGAAAVAGALALAAIPLARGPAADEDRWPTGVEAMAVDPGGGAVGLLAVDGRCDAGRLLEALRERGIHRVDTLVARSGAPAVRESVDALYDRVEVDRVLAAPAAAIDGATPVLDTAVTVAVGADTVAVSVSPDDPDKLTLGPAS